MRFWWRQKVVRRFTIVHSASIFNYLRQTKISTCVVYRLWSVHTSSSTRIRTKLRSIPGLEEWNCITLVHQPASIKPCFLVDHHVSHEQNMIGFRRYTGARVNGWFIPLSQRRQVECYNDNLPRKLEVDSFRAFDSSALNTTFKLTFAGHEVWHFCPSWGERSAWKKGFHE